MCTGPTDYHRPDGGHNVHHRHTHQLQDDLREQE
jgi:hypothetical protein